MVADLIEGPLLPVLQLLPPTKDPKEHAVTLLQAFYRGQNLRFCGWKKFRFAPGERRRLLKSFVATTTIMISDGNCASSDTRGSTYPLLLRIRPNWKGEITRIKMFNLRTDAMGMLVLKTTFRLPISASHSYSLTMTCSRLQQSISKYSCVDTDSDEEVELVTEVEDATSPLYLIVIKFSEIETGSYLLRQLYLSLSEDGSLSTIENSIDTFVTGNHNPSQIDLPPYLEDSTQMTEVATIEEPSFEDLPHSVDDTFPSQLPGDSTVDTNSASFVEGLGEWNEEGTISGPTIEDSMTSMESLMSLFTPYRPRKGLYRYFGTLYLYNATFINNSNQQSEVISTPSARAMSEANRLSNLQRKNTLQLRCLEVNSGKRLLFILPPRLAVIQNLDDVFPILLGSVQATATIPTQEEEASRESLESEIMLTPRRHGISLLDGTLQLLVKVTQSSHNEIIVRLAVPQPNSIADGDEVFPVSSEDEFIASVRKVLAVHQNKNQAWNRLQEHVCQSYNDMDLENCSLEGEKESIEQEVGNEVAKEESQSDKSIDASFSDTPSPMRRKGGFRLGERHFLYNAHLQLNDQLTIRLHLLSPQDTVVTFILAPRSSSFYQHLDTLLQLVALHFDEFTNVGTVIVTDQTASLSDLEYLDAVREFFNPPPPMGIHELSCSLVKSWLSTAKEALLKLHITTEEEEPQSPRVKEKVPSPIADQPSIQDKPSAPLASNSTITPIIVPVNPAPVAHVTSPLVVEGKDSFDGSAGAFTSEVLDQPTNVADVEFEEDCSQARMTLTTAVVSQWIEDGINSICKDIIAEREEVSINKFLEIIQHPPPPMSPEPTTKEEVSDLPLVHLEDLLDPFEDCPDLEMIQSPLDLEKPSPMVPSVNVQAAFFLAFQEQRLSCLDYLADRAAKAKHQMIRQHAFEFLKDRVKLAQVKIENKHRNGDSSSVIVRKLSIPAKKKVMLSDGAPEILTNFSIEEEKDIMSPLDSKGNRKVARQHSAPSFKEKGAPLMKERRRGSMPATIIGKSSTPPAVVSDFEESSPPDSAEQLHDLLDFRLKDESFTEHPQDLVNALQSLSSDIPSVCASPRFMALSQAYLEDTSEVRDAGDPTFSSASSPIMDRSPLPRTASIFTSNKFSEWDSKIETMKSANGLAPIGMGKRNPIDFLDSHAHDTADTPPIKFSSTSPSNPMFEESISNYLQKGYSTGTCAYLAIWKQKIISCIKSFQSPIQLDKAIYSLQRSYPEPLTRAGALCALSETNGSVGEALGQLNDKTFKHELVLVCQALPLEEIVNRLGEYKKAHQHQRTVSSLMNQSSSATGTGTLGEKTIEDLLWNTQIMRNNSEYVQDSPDPLSFPEASPRIFQGGEFRFPTNISRSLPHFGMVSTSPTVLSRGNLVKRTRENVKGVVSSDPTHLPPITKTYLSKSLGSLPVQTEEPSRPTNLSQTQAPHRYSRESEKKSKKSLQDNSSSKLPSALPRSSRAGAGGTAPPKFTRVGKTIDMLAEQSDTLVVMSRIGAYRAQEEELLLKYHPEQDSYFRSSRQKKFLGKLSPVV